MTGLEQWPDDLLDIAEIRAEGFAPQPFAEYVLTVHQRCQGSRPTLMAAEVWRTAAARIAEHARTHGLAPVRVVLGGGEPLLAGVDRLRALVDDVRSALVDICEPHLRVRTNGLLLADAVLRALGGDGVGVEVAVPAAARTGGALHQALALLGQPAYRPMFTGLRCPVDPGVDPVACYESLVAYQPTVLDLRLPRADWSRPPPRPDGGGADAYGDWLIAVFDRWYGAPRQETGVPILEEIINLVLGGAGGRSDQVGPAPTPVVVIGTDGAIGPTDRIRPSGCDVFTDSLDAALAQPGFVARQLGVRALSPTCVRCPVHGICGGGAYAHRYRAAEGYHHPSVYCGDMFGLIDHIQRRVTRDLVTRVTGDR